MWRYQQREYAETIFDSTSPLLNIINDILDLSRIEAGRLDLEIRDLDVRKMAGRVVNQLALAAEQKGRR